MASQSQGIQQLLRAEKAAAEKVNEARKRKARRLKQAKDEAQREVEVYRSQRENQFKQYEAEHMGTRTDIAQRIDTETNIKLKEMDGRVKGSQERVINLLLQYVCEVKPQLHQNINSGLA